MKQVEVQSFFAYRVEFSALVPWEVIVWRTDWRTVDQEPMRPSWRVELVVDLRDHDRRLPEFLVVTLDGRWPETDNWRRADTAVEKFYALANQGQREVVAYCGVTDYYAWLCRRTNSRGG